MKIDYTTWILIGGVISLLGAAIAAWASYKSRIESGKQTDQIINTSSDTNILVKKLKEKNKTLTTKLELLKNSSEYQSQKVRDLTNLNADLSIQLSKSTNLISQSITGGNGFCELDFVTTKKSNHGKVFIKNHGKYPLHDFTARVCELEEYDVFTKNNPGIPQSGSDMPKLLINPKFPDFNIDLGTLLAGDRKEIPHLILLGKYGKKKLI